MYLVSVPHVSTKSLVTFRLFRKFSKVILQFVN